MKRTASLVAAALLVIGLLMTGLLTTGCGGVPSDAVATVGDASVTKADFQTLLTQAKTQVEAQGSTFPAEGTAEYDEYVAQIIDYLVQEQIVEQRAGDLGASVTDEEVDEQITQIKETYGGEKKVLALLKEQGMTMELLRRSLRSQALTSAAAEVVVKKAAVSDADIQAYWKAHKAQLSKKKATATLAKAKTTIRSTLLSAAQQQLWEEWVVEQTKALGVEYGAGYDPAELTASASASPSAESGG